MTPADNKISICDVGPRDGLQNESVILSPEIRAELVKRLAGAGLRRVEAVSFMRDDRVPAMAGAEEVIERARELAPDVTLAALVANDRGFKRAVAAGVDELRIVLPVTDTFAKANQGMTVRDGIDISLGIIGGAKEAGIPVSVCLAMSFGCPFEGKVAPERVVAIADELWAASPDELFLADSIGVGVPAQVRELFAAVGGEGRNLGCHFHNSRNTGYANVLAAVEAGVRSVDASVGGLGGCPFAPGATGNIATEDTVYLLDGMGYETGIDADALGDITRWLGDQVKHEMPSLVTRAGACWGGLPLPA